MMKKDIERLIEIIKEQTQMFLLDAGAFYPFGSCIDKNNKLKPVGGYLENDNPSSPEVISLLEENMKKGIQDGEYKIAALVIDVTIKEEDVDYDAIEVRFFEMGKESKKYIKYNTHNTHIEFLY